MKTLRLALLLLLILSGSEVRAGRNVFTDSVPHHRHFRGFPVHCTNRTGPCTHGGAALVVTRDGLRFRTTVRVYRLRKGYGVQANVEVTVADGKRHGVIRSLTSHGAVRPMTRRLVPSYGWRGRYRGAIKMPQLHRGGRLRLSCGYPLWNPASLTSTGVTSDYRLRMRVHLAGVRHYHPKRDRSPQVAEVIFSVPRRGPPRIRIKRP